MTDPLVSVVMPSFNSAAYLHQAIKSVTDQTYTNLEILIMDDCSTDQTVSIARSFKDTRIKVYESAFNKGQADQLNMGIEISKGEYICVMHSDDIMHKKKIERQLNFMHNNPLVDVCGCNVKLAGDGDGVWKYPESGQGCKDLLLSSVPFAHPAVMMKKAVLNGEAIIYHQEMVPVEDYDLWVRLATVAHFGNIQEELLQYRLHPNQIGKLKKDKEKILLDEVRLKMISQLFGVDESNVLLCFKTLYYTQEVDSSNAIKAIGLLWEFNKKNTFFSKDLLKARLKHIVLKIFYNIGFFQRVKYMLTIKVLIEICFFKTMMRVLFFIKKPLVKNIDE